jgi:hypothetical protein
MSRRRVGTRGDDVDGEPEGVIDALWQRTTGASPSYVLRQARIGELLPAKDLGGKGCREARVTT